MEISPMVWVLSFGSLALMLLQVFVHHHKRDARRRAEAEEQGRKRKVEYIRLE